MWRAADDALLGRLEDEAVLERLWAQAAPGAEALHPRAAGMIRMLRERGAKDAIAQATRGDARVLLSVATPARLETMSPALVHHLALFHRARAEHAAGRSVASGPPRDALDRSLGLTIAGWLALGREGAYVKSLAADVIAGALPASDVERAVHHIPLRGIDAVAAIARSGAEAREPSRARAFVALAAIEDAITIAGVSGELATRARAHAASARAGIVHTLLAPLSIEIEELGSREWKVDEVAAVFERALDAWRWTGGEAELERFAVRELPRFGWDLYRERRWDDFRTLLRPIVPLVERLAQRIEGEPSEIAWAAQCSQALVFRAELGPTLDVQLALAEHALRLCPTLRNARLVLADLLCARAERRIEQPALLRASDAHRDAVKDLERAESLFPDLKRLPGLRERLGRKGAA